MNRTILLIFALLPICTFSQELIEDYNQSCDWYIQAIQTQDAEERLQIVKENFREYGNFEEDDPCKILYLLSVNDRYYILSRDSSVGYFYPELMINAAKTEEIDTIHFLNKKVTETLYSKYMDGAILISSSSINYEKRIDSIWNMKKL